MLYARRLSGLKKKLVCHFILAANVFQEHLTSFTNVKSITFPTMKLVHQVRGFEVNEGGGEIGQIGVKVSE